MIAIRNMSVARGQGFRLTIPELDVQAGDILCITGPNGSGKTTLIDCLAGLTEPTTGYTTIDGTRLGGNMWRTQSKLGLIPDDEAWLVRELSAREYFALMRQVYREAGSKAPMEQLEATMASELHFTAFDQHLGSLSHGNKKKVQIIAALMHQPPCIIVDELRNGLDPLAIIAAEHILQRAAAEGAAVVTTTHDLWWAQRIASDVLLLVDGSIAAYDTIERLLSAYGSLEKLFMRHMGVHG